MCVMERIDHLKKMQEQVVCVCVCVFFDFVFVRVCMGLFLVF